MLSPPDLGSLRWPRRTARLTLRPMTLDDVDAVLTFRGRADVARWLSHEAMTRDEVVDRVTDRVDRGRSGSARPLLGLVVAQRGIVVGDAMLRIDRCRSVTRTPAPEWEGTLGYTLHPDVQGQGLAGEVARALLTTRSPTSGFAGCSPTPTSRTSPPTGCWWGRGCAGRGVRHGAAGPGGPTGGGPHRRGRSRVVRDG